MRGGGQHQNLRGAYGLGSRATSFREKKKQADLLTEGKKCYDIGELWKRQASLGISMPSSSAQYEFPDPATYGDCLEIDESQAHQLEMRDVPAGRSREITKQTQLLDARAAALDELSRLLRRKTDQIAKFGPGGLKGHLLKRYEMVYSFLLAQKKRPGELRKEVALSVAHAFGRGEHTARWIIRWEKLWVRNEDIPASSGRSCAASKRWQLESLLCDEGLQLKIRSYLEEVKDGIVPSTHPPWGPAGAGKKKKKVLPIYTSRNNGT